MEIKVRDLLAEEVVFEGFAEDFLFNNNNDTELETLLVRLEESRKLSMNYYSEDGQPYLVEKVFEDIY